MDVEMIRNSKKSISSLGKETVATGKADEWQEWSTKNAAATESCERGILVVNVLKSEIFARK